MRRYKVKSERVTAYRNTEQPQLWAVIVGGRLPAVVVEQSADRLNFNELLLARYRVAYQDRRCPDGTFTIYNGDPVKRTEEEIKANILKYRLKIVNHSHEVLRELQDEAKVPDRVYCWSRTRRIAKERARRAAKVYTNVEVVPTVLLRKGES